MCLLYGFSKMNKRNTRYEKKKGLPGRVGCLPLTLSL